MMGYEYEIELIPDEKIRKWMDGEIARLGDRLSGFEITWHCNYKKHWLEIWSETHMGTFETPLFGRGLVVGEVADPFGESVPAIQSAGRKLFYRLKKDYPSVHRDLGGYDRTRRRY